MQRVNVAVDGGVDPACAQLQVAWRAIMATGVAERVIPFVIYACAYYRAVFVRTPWPVQQLRRVQIYVWPYMVCPARRLRSRSRAAWTCVLRGLQISCADHRREGLSLPYVPPTRARGCVYTSVGSA